ncbi:MAG: RIP metalloprotease RseP [Lachnospiraceae bacterium]|jgi:regulator of sigma E protease|nr:RIP metalloprotease RseP [Lachnospiraceae bacterium]
MNLSTIINVIIGLFVFGLIIFFHELGHFLLAKKNGIHVIEFAVGMGPKIFSFQKKETKYSLRAIPMGGFCMMLGEEEEVDDEHSFSSKGVLARFAVVVAGPIFNFILAFILSLVLIGLCGYDKPVIYGFSETSPAYVAGVREGDTIMYYNGHRIFNFREVMVYSQLDQTGRDITLTVNRKGEKLDFTFTPEKTDNGYIMGISGGGRERKGVLNVVKYSFLEMRYQIKTVYLSLKYLITGKLGLNKLSGPVGIVSMMNDTINEAKDSAEGDTSLAIINVILNMINFSIMISANLGVMNLLPIPALDGGRALFLVFEGIFKKRIPIKIEAVINSIGFALLLGLMAIVLCQDIFKIMVR